VNVPNPLRVVRAADVTRRAPDETPWLIEGLWGAGGVGVIGGSAKSFLSRARNKKLHPAPRIMPRQ
jgi:hypothetical protein